MYLEHHPARNGGAVGSPAANVRGSPPGQDKDPGYWFSLIDEKLAAEFLDVTDRTMQKMRQRGDGCRFVKISSRCIKYRRVDLLAFADDRLWTIKIQPEPQQIV